MSSARSWRERSSELRYSAPLNPNLMALMRDALNANVAQPITTPIRTPAIKPHFTMMTMIASSDRYSVIDRRRLDSMIQRLSWSLPR